MLTQRNPPSTRTLEHSHHTRFRSLWVSKNAPSRNPSSIRLFTLSVKNISSHIAIIGYGGEVTTRCTDSSSAGTLSALPHKNLWVVFTSIITAGVSGLLLI